MTTVDYRVAGPTLERFFADSSFARFLVGPFGSGKTSACCVEVFRRCQQQAPGPDGVRRSKVAVIRSTFRQLSGTTVPSWRNWFGDQLGLFRWSEPFCHEMRFNLPDGSRVEADVQFIALDGPDAEAKLRGLEVSFAWVNECSQLPKAVLSFLVGRLGRYPSVRDGGPTWAGLICDTNPFDRDHHLFKLLEEERPEGWRLFKQPGGVTWDGKAWVANPAAENLANLPGGSGYYLRQLSGQSHDWIRVYLGGEYGLALDGKKVFSEYVDSTHCSPEPLVPIPGAPLVIGIDFGLTPAAIVGQRSALGQWRIVAELIGQDIGVARFGEELAGMLAAWFPGFDDISLWGDPAGAARSQTDERTALGVVSVALGRTVRAAPTNSLLPRLEAIRRPLSRLLGGAPGFVLSPACKVLRKGLAGGYHYRRVQVAAERYADRPEKNEFSHPVDALGYLLCGGGEARALLSRGDQRPIVAIHDFDPLTGRSSETELRVPPYDVFAGTSA